MKQRVEIHVEELVLHGFDPARRHLIADHLAAALGPALADGGVAWADRDLSIDQLDVAPVAVEQPITARGAARLGDGVARSIRRGP